MRVLSIFSGHDASATLVNNGKIEKYFKEERYSKIKKDKNIENIFNICLEKYVEHVDYIKLAVSEDREFREKILYKNPKIKFIDDTTEHHLYHAALSFYNSGFDRALIVVIDSAGKVINNNIRECESIYIGEYPNKLNPIYKNYFTEDYTTKNFHKTINGCEYICKTPIGIGGVYVTAAYCIGQTEDDCGKAMGLSSYGNSIEGAPKFFANPESNLLIQPSLGSWVDQYVPEYYYGEDLRRNIKITRENYKHYADYCHEVQRQTQEVFCELIKKGIEKTGIKKVCISGGYGMNIIANHYATKIFPKVEFFFEPLCDDGGISSGSSLFYYRKITKDCKVLPIQTTANHGLYHDISKYKGSTANTNDIVELLYQNKSVALYYGHAESGQRALGNRSILFNALNPDARDIVNKIKKREWYRPFAAIVLEQDSGLYFDMGRVKSNPYMTMCFPVKTDLIPGVTHVDNTCRIQTVSSGHLYDILIEFKRISGHGILLNTSFNLAGEPLVESPEDAFETLERSSLDYLWFYETKQLFNCKL